MNFPITKPILFFCARAANKMRVYHRGVIASLLVVTVLLGFCFPVLAHGKLVGECMKMGNCVDVGISLYAFCECCEGSNDEFRIGLLVSEHSNGGSEFNPHALLTFSTPSFPVPSFKDPSKFLNPQIAHSLPLPFYISNLSIVI